MADIVAEDLMMRHFETVRSDRPLRAAMQALVRVQSEASMPNALAVIDSDGAYEGILSARLLARSLLSLWMPSKSLLEEPVRLEAELLEVVRDRARVEVHDALIRGLPTAKPGDRLMRLIELAKEHQLEFVPVVEDRVVHGLVPVTGVFLAVAGLVLTPGDEGIRID